MSNHPLRRVFIASPLAPHPERTMEFHLDYARDCMRDSLENHGEFPYVPHLLYTQVLNDASKKDRDLALAAGMAWLRASDMLVVYDDYGVSPGMKREIEYAQKNRIPLQYRRIRMFG